MRLGAIRRILLLLIAVVVVAGAAQAAQVPIDCATTVKMRQARTPPRWFPTPQPPGVFEANGTALPIFTRGLVWGSRAHYLWLGREQHGANLGEIGIESKTVARVFLGNIHAHVRVLRLAHDGRLFAEWPTLGRYPDVTAAVAKGQTVPQFLSFLRSLRRLAWPPRCQPSG